MGAHLDGGRITAEIVRIAAMPGGARQRAEALIDSLRPLLRHDAAWLSLLDPDGRRQQPITAPGHTGRLQRHLAGREFMAVLERVGLHRARRPMRVFESPVPVEELPSWVDYFQPDGFAEGVALPLVTADGRYLGLLGAHAGSPDPLSDELCDLLATLAPLIAHAVDPLRTLAALAGMVHGATAGVVLTRSGRTELLPGMPGPSAFGVDPPALHLVGALLAPGRSIARFMVPSTDPERGLVQVTALACPPEPPGHHRALVLLGPPPETYGLTRREMQVLGLLVEGRSNAAIAGALRITPRTVIGHLEHIMVKMGAESRTAAAVRADRQGLYVPAELLRRCS